MKRILALLLTAAALLALAACSATRTVHCDHCGETVIIEANSNMEESWIIFCEKCNEELFGDDPMVEPG